MYQQIPGELKSLRNWVCWKRVHDPKHPEKPKKVPINARTGMEAASDNPSTWCDFQTAVESSVEFAGIGFMFGGSGYLHPKTVPKARPAPDINDTALTIWATPNV